MVATIPDDSLYPSTSTFPRYDVPVAPVRQTPTRDVPHFQWPFVRTGGRVRTVEQDTPDHVLSCCDAIARCPAGSRAEAPEFGWAFPEFRNAPLDPDGLTSAIGRLEPRTRATAREHGDPYDESYRYIDVSLET